MQKKSVARFKQGVVALPVRLKTLWNLSMTETKDSSPRSSSPTARGTGSPSMSGSESSATPAASAGNPSSSSSFQGPEYGSWSRTAEDHTRHVHIAPSQLWADGVVKPPAFFHRLPNEVDDAYLARINAEKAASEKVYKEGFDRWSESIASETGIPVAQVVSAAVGRESLPTALQPTEEDRIAAQRMVAYAMEAETLQHAADRKVTITVGELDGLIDSFLGSQQCTLWGEQWTITDRRGRARAHTFIRKTMLQVIGEEV